ncbi:MAG TPA: glycoside hydrolase family 43 protein [Opitutaceae bacterium]
MPPKTALFALLPLLSIGSLLAEDPKPSPVAFDWFEYSGRDAIFEGPLRPESYRNPILAGFYPDPSLCRVGDDYYLVNSTFSYFPGIPVFHSRDLVKWRQLGHVIERPSQADFNGLGVSRGVFAPAISHHDGTFYVVTTLVDAGGNCFFTAKNPAGPWSEPVWLPEVDGIDPSFFFDDDGRAWLVNNGPPPDNQPRYEGHRAIWLQEFDVTAQKLVGPRTIIVNGGVDLAKQPVWIEGPHLFKRGEWYYLTCAEGGTAEDHSQVIFRSRAVTGPWIPWTGNPILTQRDLPADRPNPVTSTGHADLVELPNGDWWAVFLGCRPYDPEGRRYNTGRETFLLPVAWTEDGWPRILPAGTGVPLTAPAPTFGLHAEGAVRLSLFEVPAADPLLAAGRVGAASPLTGNFIARDEFDEPSLAPTWSVLRTPRETWWSLATKEGSLSLSPRPVGLREKGNPAFVGRRQQHARFVATTALRVPADEAVAAGLVAFQNETHHFFLGVRRHGLKREVFLERVAGGGSGGAPETIATAELSLAENIELRITGEGGACTFSYATHPGNWRVLKADVDASILSTRVAGGFVGTMLGVHARVEK